MKYLNILLTMLILTGCGFNSVDIKPDIYYLPKATIGQPYRYVIHTSGNIMYISMATWPEDTTGLDWHYSQADSTYWDKNSKQGDAIEITGIPKDNLDKEIKIAFLGNSFGTNFPGQDFYKEYIIKLVPTTQTPPAKH